MILDELYEIVRLIVCFVQLALLNKLLCIFVQFIPHSQHYEQSIICNIKAFRQKANIWSNPYNL